MISSIQSLTQTPNVLTYTRLVPQVFIEEASIGNQEALPT